MGEFVGAGLVLMHLAGSGRMYPVPQGDVAGVKQFAGRDTEVQIIEHSPIGTKRWAVTVTETYREVVAQLRGDLPARYIEE